jgi:uncharacterized repeat protein (TIGR01451 family)
VLAAALAVAAFLAPQGGAGSGDADLVVTKDDTPNTVAPGEDLTYTVKVRNRGPSSAASVVLSDPLPASVTFVSLEGPDGWDCTVPPVGATGTVSCTRSSLANDASATFTIVVKPTMAGTISNTASASSASRDRKPADNRSTELTQVSAPGPCTVVGTQGHDVLVGTEGADVVCALGGDDVVFGLGGGDILIGGAGADRLGAGSGNDRLLGGSGNDRLLGGSGNDRLEGGPGGDQLLGGAGSDRLAGGNGGDDLSGGPGNDLLSGGARNDLLAGGPGRDRLVGGPGFDRAHGGTGTDYCAAERRTSC